MLVTETAALLEAVALDLSRAAELLRPDYPQEADAFADRALVASEHASALRLAERLAPVVVER